LRSKVFDFFEKILSNEITRELNNIKVTFKNERQEDEIISLSKKLVYLTVKKDLYIKDISSMKQIDRLNYSKEIYRTIIEAYYNESNIH